VSSVAHVLVSMMYRCCHDDDVAVDESNSAVIEPRQPDVEPRFVAEVSEHRANPVVSRRGYLLVTDSKHSVPVKRWVVRHSTSATNNYDKIRQFNMD